MDVDTAKVESIWQEIVRDSKEKREDNLLVILATDLHPVSPQLHVKYTVFPMMELYIISLEDW